MHDLTIAQARKGDSAAQEALVQEYYGYVMGFLVKLTFNRDLSQDLTQETFIRALRALPSWRGDSEIGTWLVAIARNLYRDHLRSMKRRRQVPLEDLPVSDEGLAAQGMELGLQAREALTRLKSLPLDRREIILLKYYYGFSSKEIARMLHLPEGTVRSRLHYALKSLAADEGEEEHHDG